MRLSLLLTQALLCTVVFLGLPMPVKAVDFAAVCEARDKPYVTKEQNQAATDQMARGKLRIDYPPPPPNPWHPPEWEQLSIMDAGRTDPRLVGWRFKFFTPCPPERAQAAMAKYGGFGNAMLQILLPESILQPPEGSTERIVAAAVEIGKKIVDKGYDIDTLNFGVQVVDNRVLEYFQAQFTKRLETKKPAHWREIEDCEQTFVLTRDIQPPARCMNFDYLRRMHLAAPNKKTLDFIEVLSATNDAFSAKLRADCTQESRLCTTLKTASRGSNPAPK